MLTLSSLQSNRGLLAIANFGGTSTAFIGLVNDAVRELMGIPDGFWNTIVKARMQAYDNSITWPAWVGSLKAVNVCAHPTPVWNRWYSFLPLDSGDYRPRHDWCSGVKIVNDGTQPVFNNVPGGSANYLQVYRRASADNGKTMVVWGMDGNWQPVEETITFADGVANTVTLANGVVTNGWVRSTNTFQRIDRIHKDVTTGLIDVYQYDSTNNQLIDTGHYLSGETDPDYVHSRIIGGCPPCTSTTAITLTILAKQQFVPMSGPTDLVQIDNIEAIKHMIQALKYGEAANPQGYAVEKAMAVKILNQQLEDKFPDQQIPIRYDPFNGADLTAHSTY